MAYLHAESLSVGSPLDYLQIARELCTPKLGRNDDWASLCGLPEELSIPGETRSTNVPQQ
jgi:hypothetical protein